MTAAISVDGVFSPVEKPTAFVLLPCAHGTLIVNKNDVQMVAENIGLGVGRELFQKGTFSVDEISCLSEFLIGRKASLGPGVLALDCGANIGTHTLVWAHLMSRWGRVMAFEPQERIYYALAGNIALNNCFNASARHCALGAQCATIVIDEPNPFSQTSFGSFEILQNQGQGNRVAAHQQVPVITVDSLGLERVDLIKIDCEGMELEVLMGAQQTIARSRPILFVEIIKCDRAAVETLLTQMGYRFIGLDINLLAVHQDDPLRIKLDGGQWEKSI